MKKILALDPGVTTGYAIFEDGKLIESGNLQPEDLDESILTTLLPEETYVIVESVPYRATTPIGREVQTVVSWIMTHFHIDYWLQPALWKQNRHVQYFKFPIEQFPHPTRHQRDAFYIGVFAREFAMEKQS